MTQNFALVFFGIIGIGSAFFQYLMASGLTGKETVKWSDIDSFSRGRIITQLLVGVGSLLCLVYKLIMRML